MAKPRKFACRKRNKGKVNDNLLPKSRLAYVGIEGTKTSVCLDRHGARIVERSPDMMIGGQGAARTSQHIAIRQDIDGSLARSLIGASNRAIELGSFVVLIAGNRPSRRALAQWENEHKGARITRLTMVTPITNKGHIAGYDVLGMEAPDMANEYYAIDYDDSTALQLLSSETWVIEAALSLGAKPCRAAGSGPVKVKSSGKVKPGKPGKVSETAEASLAAARADSAFLPSRDADTLSAYISCIPPHLCGQLACQIWQWTV